MRHLNLTSSLEWPVFPFWNKLGQRDTPLSPVSFLHPCRPRKPAQSLSFARHPWRTRCLRLVVDCLSAGGAVGTKMTLLALSQSGKWKQMGWNEHNEKILLWNWQNLKDRHTKGSDLNADVHIYIRNCCTVIAPLPRCCGWKTETTGHTTAPEWKQNRQRRALFNRATLCMQTERKTEQRLQTCYCG